MRSTLALIVATTGFVGLTTLSPSAQSTPGATMAGRLTFDVATIKRNVSEDLSGGAGFRAGGLFASTNMPARALIIMAFRNAATLLSSQVVGLPAWATTDKFDISARTPAEAAKEPLTIQQSSLYVRSLLEDRFGLRAHFEKREVPTYALKLAASDGRVGPQLRPSAGDCAARAQALRDATAAGRTPPPAGEPCGIRGGPGHFSGGDVLISTLIGTLAGATGRIVQDRTTLDRRFDITLDWTADLGGADAGDRTSIFTALQEQLGLKLESTRGSVDVLVIDHIEPPTPN